MPPTIQAAAPNPGGGVIGAVTVTQGGSDEVGSGGGVSVGVGPGVCPRASARKPAQTTPLALRLPNSERR